MWGTCGKGTLHDQRSIRFALVPYNLLGPGGPPGRAGVSATDRGLDGRKTQLAGELEPQRTSRTPGATTSTRPGTSLRETRAAAARETELVEDRARLHVSGVGRTCRNGRDLSPTSRAQLSGPGTCSSTTVSPPRADDLLQDPPAPPDRHRRRASSLGWGRGSSDSLELRLPVTSPKTTRTWHKVVQSWRTSHQAKRGSSGRERSVRQLRRCAGTSSCTWERSTSPPEQ